MKQNNTKAVLAKLKPEERKLYEELGQLIVQGRKELNKYAKTRSILYNRARNRLLRANARKGGGEGEPYKEGERGRDRHY